MKKIMRLFSRILSMVLVTVMLMSCMPVVNATTSGKTQSDAVAWATSKIGQSLDYDGVYGAQCVDFTKYYYAYLGVSPVLGNGCDYATNSLPSGWTRIKYYSGFVPEPGDIAVWTYASSAYGHVAIVTSATSSSMNVVEQNGSTHITKASLYYYTFGKFYGVIRPDFAGGTSSTPSVSYSSVTESNYNIINKSSGKYLNAFAGAGAAKSGTNICASNADNSAEQKFKIQAYGNNQYYIRSLSNSSEYCVNANSPNNVVISGANVELYNYNTVASKLWYFEDVGSGYYKIRNVMNPSLVLSAVSDVARANVCVKTDSDSDLQKWQLVNLASTSVSTSTPSTNASSVRESNFNIICKAGGKYLNAYAYPGQATAGKVSSGIGTNVCISNSDGTMEQQWKLEHYGDNKYYIRSLSNSGQYCVNAYSPNDYVADGADVRLYYYNTTASKHWYFESDGNGYYVIRNAMNTNLVLTAVDGSHGANVIVKSYTGYDNQKWKLVDLNPETSAEPAVKSSYIDMNSYYNGSEHGTLADVGTADVYINGTLVADDVSDFYTQYPDGTMYEITDIKGINGYSYVGVYNGSLSGTVTASSDSASVGICLKFEKTTSEFTSSELDTDEIYSIVNKSAGTYLNAFASDGKVTVKTNVCASNGDSSNEQKFKLQSVGDGKYLIRSLSNANLYCVDVYTPSNAVEDGANVWMYYNTEFASKHWYFEDIGDGYYVIRNALNTNLVLTAVDNNHRANVIVKTYMGYDNQKWKLTTVSSDSTGSSGGTSASQNENIQKLNSVLRKWINVGCTFSLDVSTSKTQVIDYNNPPVTMDCSSFTSSIYLTVFGVDIGRNTRIQQKRGAPVGTEKAKNQYYSDLQIGDLILFDWGGDGVPDHVGIYSGNGNYIHMTTNNKVMESSFTYKNRYTNILTIRRIIQQDGSLYPWPYTTQGDDDVYACATIVREDVTYFFDNDENQITGITSGATYGELLLNTDYAKMVVYNSNGGEIITLTSEEITTGEYSEKDMPVLAGTIANFYDASGNLVFVGECIVDGESGTALYGDVNNDGVVDGLDATRLMQYMAEWEVDIDLRASDVYNDGNIDGLDVTTLLKYLAEWDVTLG